jgi:tRNA pseudouridine38-40 synthase
MKRFLIKLAYDGTLFQGWQSQKKGRTVQQEVEKALTLIAKSNIPITAAGRTDAGVHALTQCAHFDFPIEMSADQLCKAIQRKCPADIQIVAILEVAADFNARFDAYQRSYEYVICKKQTPFNRYYKSHFNRKSFNAGCINACLTYFLGEHDFTSFSKFNPQVKSPLCTINEFTLKETSEDFILTISANRFLHNMVRRIVDTIINICHSKQDPQIIEALIEARSTQNKLISTAPPNGLYLKEILYPNL